jgi:hypothetical protein
MAHSKTPNLPSRVFNDSWFKVWDDWRLDILQLGVVLAGIGILGYLAYIGLLMQLP